MEVDRVQPRPSRRGRSRDPEGPLGDSAPTDHRHPRPDRDHQPPSRPAPTRLLALGIGVEPAVGQHDRTANLRRLLTTQPAPARPEDPMESVRSGYRRPPETQSRSNQVVRRSEDPHRWIQAQGTVSSGISGSTPRDAIARIQPVRDSDRTAPLADYCPLPATPSAATKPSVRTGPGTRSSQISRQ
jgi:hypothetical protein